MKNSIGYKVKKGVSVRNILLISCLIAIIALFGIYIFNQKKQMVQAQAVPKPINTHAAIPLTAEQNFQLNNARDILLSGRIAEAREIYRTLAIQDIPEAMYEYGNLTLLNNADKTNCAEAIDYLKKAMRKGYVPAKRTVGLLYSFAADSLVLKQKGYQGCDLNVDIKRGSKLLMEATLEGDSTASLLLDELNLKYGMR